MARALAVHTPDGYSVMMIIPISDLRVQNSKEQTWRLNFSRRIAATNTLLTWAYDDASVAYCGNNGGNPISYCEATRWPSIQTIALASAAARPAPYADIYALGSTGSQRDIFETTPGNFTQRQPRAIGIDATIPITSTLAFVGALAPDFSNVEADQSTIAPQEFAIRYSEYRPFFAQGAQYISGIPNFNVNRYQYSAFYSPAIGVFDTGYKLEGTAGRNAIGALTVRGPGVNDQVFGLSNSAPDGSLSISGGGVFAHHDGVTDQVVGGGISFTNLRTGFEPIASIAFERGTNVADPAQARDINVGFLSQHGTLQAGVVYRDIGPQYNPLDGYVTLNDVRGPQAFLVENFVGPKTSPIKTIQLAYVTDRFLDRSGAVHAADTSVSAGVTLNNLFAFSINGGASELRSYDAVYPVYTNGQTNRFDQTGFAVGYKDGTPSATDANYSYGPFALGCSGTQTQSLACGSAPGGFVPAFVQQLDLMTARTFGRGYGISFEYGGTIERAARSPEDSQWLRRASLTRAFGSEGQLAVGLRSISGTGGYAAPGVNLAVSYHQRFANASQLYFEYGTPAANATLHRIILKYVFHIGGGAGT